MKWHDMAPFYQGGDDDRAEFSVPLEPDEDGFVGRTCPREECRPRYFKITPRSFPDDASEEEIQEQQETLFCPYCGRQDGFQQFTTENQWQHIQSLIRRDMVRAIQAVFQDSFRPRASSSGFGVRFRPGTLPPVEEYAEKELWRTLDCHRCGRQYAVDGPAPFCPLCGAGNLHRHLLTEVQSIRARLQTDPPCRAERRRHLCNCLEDCVSLFEGLLRKVYSQALLGRVTPEEREKRIRKQRQTFQKIDASADVFQKQLAWELFGETAAPDLDFMRLQFAKRHVVTHNLGVVDERFLRDFATGQDLEEDVEIHLRDIERLLTLIQAVLGRAITQFTTTSP